ncbi:MAG: fimbria/pilus outer membrane usher protein [Acidobacteriota bacterium]
MTLLPHAMAQQVPALPLGDEPLLLEVQINGYSTGKIAEFTLRNGKLLCRPTELAEIGLRVPPSVARSSDGLVALLDIAGVKLNLDQKNQELYLTVSDSHLLPAIVHLNGDTPPLERRVVESGTGLTMNYDVAGTHVGRDNGGVGSLDLRAFSPWGIVSSQWLAYAGASTPHGADAAAVRLDTVYTLADVNSLRRYSLGDFITGGLSWTRPIHMEGGQVLSDFSLRPDLITFPLPIISGTAAAPSTIDVLANGAVLASSSVNAGPFQVPQLPVVTGAGTISLTLTNALGQQVNVSQPFYASSALLAPGLQTYSAQAGLVRLNWGSVSDDYGSTAASATWRRGITPRLTLEGSAEGTSGAFTAGAGAVAQIGTLGIVNISAASSAGAGIAGTQVTAGAQRIGSAFSIGASATMATRNYRDVAAQNGDGVLRKQLSGFASLSLRRFGSAGIAYASSVQDAAPATAQLSSFPGVESHVISANYSVQIHHVSVFASEFKTFGSDGGTSGFQAGLTIPLTRRSSADFDVSSNGNTQVQVQQSVITIGDWGYDVFVSAGDASHQFAQVQYKSPISLVTGGVDHGAGQTTVRLEAQGALSLIDRAVFPSNQINDSFAVIDTSPMAHVHVFQENRDVGTTSSSGRLLVPDMRSFDLNHISIQPTDIPADVTVNSANRDLRPQQRSGVIVRFPIAISHGALLRLVDASGQPLPIGSSVTLRSTNTAYPVGYDGEAYIENLMPHNEVIVERGDGTRCRAAFDYTAISGEIPVIGPLKCVDQEP